MTGQKADTDLKAVQTIYNALKEFDDTGRQRVLASVLALLDMPIPSFAPSSQPPANLEQSLPKQKPPDNRPKGLAELMQEKSPGSNSQRIALFAYFREKYESQSRFSRTDLEQYFGKAKLSPPANFDRDFNVTVG